MQCVGILAMEDVCFKGILAGEGEDINTEAQAFSFT